MFATFEAPRKVLVENGSDLVKLESTTSEKTSFRALGAISCASQKLPLWVLAKGRTVQCDRKFGHHPMVIFRHSESRWATEKVTVELIEWLQREIADYRPCVFIMDVYPSHLTDRVLVATEAEDVRLLFVPTGGTGRFQQMDRRIFAELKARGRADFASRLWREGSETMDHQTSVDILEKNGHQSRQARFRKRRTSSN
jgi:hypothetical protein